ncbi:hypothetical protein FA13DRAFT_937122 [Coprinellus micaceus]|uniref:CBM1 domain-containing protein n=1 Tax=Coprinellus micaceus TaxID=71717 RepID=A0A4Y7T021_COPMI|nr:hypothetical protein FA13DRAFT_937122 [Coprinellus micaceus]
MVYGLCNWSITVCLIATLLFLQSAANSPSASPSAVGYRDTCAATLRSSLTTSARGVKLWKLSRTTQTPSDVCKKGDPTNPNREGYLPTSTTPPSHKTPVKRPARRPPPRRRRVQSVEKLAPTPVVSVPGYDVPLDGQCGGTGYDGPTVCERFVRSHNSH